jgi:uncharacterized protein (DUF1697 family)
MLYNPAMGKDSYVALLRGINVGGKHKLPMKDLAELLATTHCKNIRTYIQSGNVVFSATQAVARGLVTEVATKIGERFGFAVPVVIRSAAEMVEVVRNNPFLARGLSEKDLHVGFLASRPSAEAVAKLDHQRSPGDEFEVVGTEIYFYLPNGAGQTKLTNAYLDSRLATISTSRNWATVLKLCEMAQQ